MVLNVTAGATPARVRTPQDRQIPEVWMLLRQDKKLRMEEQLFCLSGAEQQTDPVPPVLAYEPVNHRANGSNAGAGREEHSILVRLLQKEGTLRRGGPYMRSVPQCAQAGPRRSFPAGLGP